ncbi:MAG TPA: flagellar biosynthetic protein FliR, partial [Phycisphaerales bacterium]|nr:flagellar biosynthetic protein FliR [Phycisphaerales bacterium]
MPDFEPYIHHLPLFALVLARFSGLFLFSPVLSSTMVPRQARVALMAGFALAVYASLDLSAIPADISLFALLPSMFAELIMVATTPRPALCASSR